MRTLNLTIIGDENCSTTRVYLAYLQAAGLRPRQLWLVDFRPASPKPSTMRRCITSCLSVFRRSKTAPVDPEFRDLCQKLQKSMPVQVNFFKPLDLGVVAEVVKKFKAESYEDPVLQARIFQNKEDAFLYTNGGIVPSTVLNYPGIKFLHIHPGIVPEMRGSDCLLWSHLIKARFGMSCFYMSPGIDEGAVIGQKEYEVGSLSALQDYLTPEKEGLAYRALLYAFDPHLRAQLLIDILRQSGGGDLRKIESHKQAKTSRPAYLWMHPRLRLLTICRLSA